MEWGIAMTGCETPILTAIHDIPRHERFSAVEIGVAEGRTSRAIYDFLSATRKEPFEYVAVDIPEGWSLNTGAITENWRGRDIRLELVGSESFLINRREPIDFLLIDGCHGYGCVSRDFVMAESKLSNGAVVVFHDTEKECQGIDIQPHCQRPIEVRRAIRNLFFGGLELDQLLTRPGYVLLSDVPGCPDGRGCVIIKKVGD